MAEITIGFVLNELGALAIIGLGLFVWRVRPSGAANQAFALLVGAWAIALFLYNMAVADILPRGFQTWPIIILYPMAAAAALALARVFPSRLRRGELIALGPSYHLAWALPLLHFGYSIWWTVTVNPLYTDRVLVDDWNAERLAAGVAQAVYRASLIALFMVLALRYAASEDARFRRQAALLATAMFLFQMFEAGAVLILLMQRESHAVPAVGWLYLPFLGIAVLVALSWMLLSLPRRRTGGVQVTLVLLAAALTGMVLHSLLRGVPNSGGLPGLVRILASALVAYAIVSDQLFDIDLKIKWTLKQSTVAAVFIGFFFIASESAAVFLGEKWGTYGGIIAAGGLVFAIAPLQRVAERVADRAMPGIADTSDYRTRRQEEVYKVAVRLALQDGTVTRAEEHHLAEVAEGLGIPATRALRLREDVEGTTASGLDATSGEEPV